MTPDLPIAKARYNSGLSSSVAPSLHFELDSDLIPATRPKGNMISDEGKGKQDLPPKGFTRRRRRP